MLESTVGSIVGLLVLAIFLFTYAVIVRKAGFSPWWALLTLVPVVNLFALAFFTLSEWPIEKELRRLSLRPKSPADSIAESSWELKRLAKRVAMVEQLAAPEGPNASVKELLDLTGSNPTDYFNETVRQLQQFVERSANDDEKAFVKDLIQSVKTYEGR